MTPDPETERVLRRITSDKARSALRRRVTSMDEKLVLADWSASGFTSAELIGVYRAPRGQRPHSAIIKITSAGQGDREEEAHQSAWWHAPADFARMHLARPLGNPIPVEGGEWISFQQVAGGGFGELAQFGKALPDWDEAAQTCSRILVSASTEWNPESKATKAPVRDLLNELVGRRVAKGGTIRAWAANIPELLERPRRLIRCGTAILVNPFELLDDTSVGGATELLVLRGHSHGDLHPGNLLVVRHANPERLQYCLVDLSRYRPDGLLAWDPVYLTLTTVAERLRDGELANPALERLRRWLVRPDEPPRSPLPDRVVQAVIRGSHFAEEQLAREYEMRSEWQRQRLVCVIAVALMLTGRGGLLSPTHREWFFWLAAEAATELVGDTANADDEPLPRPARLITGEEVVDFEQRSRAAKLSDAAGDFTANPREDFWAQLVGELRAARLDAGDRATFAVDTEELLLLLGKPRGPSPAHTDRVEKYLRGLARVLTDALRPSATDKDVRAAGYQAQRLQGWLLDLLS
ncbi:hypothetical protein ACIRSS_23055 [Amycolatopsis sp. NPDC101161]|uniref:hypothetical protein n=1 Tax=Amycolatopsis sp. NPDC101161 TaxID=3363940 RepID=UPI003811F6EF